MPSVSQFLIATALALVLLALGSQPARALAPVYTYSYTGLDLDSDEIVDTEDVDLAFLTSGAHAELSSSQGSSASATSDFGSLRAYARTINPPGGLEQAGAISAWSDQFTISGGAGSGTALVSTDLSGSFATEYFSAYSYALVLSDNPLLPDDIFSFLNSGIPPVGSSLLLGTYGDNETQSGPVRVLLNSSFDFNYDSPFFLTGLLVVGASDSGEVDFSSTAEFGITPASGGQVNALSGTAYNSAQAVPEPGTWAMLLASLGLLGLWLRRR